MTPQAPPAPEPRLSLAITGHRESNAAFAANRAAIAATLESLFDRLAAATGPNSAPVRLHSMLVDGADQMAMALGRARGWELVAPLPFGRRLNKAINAHPLDLADGEALLGGGAASNPATQARSEAIRTWADASLLFELADRDEAIAALFLAKLAAPADLHAAQAHSFAVSERVALAAQVMIEQADLLIAIWDGASTSLTGGTGATLVQALDTGCPVLWVDARAPAGWRILLSPEELAGGTEVLPQLAERQAVLDNLVRNALGGNADHTRLGKAGYAEGVAALDAQHWRSSSAWPWHGYRRIEALFGSATASARLRSLRQTYEPPDAMLAGSASEMLGAIGALPDQDPSLVERTGTAIIRRFAWADGISARLSDMYRGGMILNFLFSALAIVGGMAYLPFSNAEHKWIFAMFEVSLLIAIVVITVIGQRRRWHGRWFETRRAAEYLRHAPILLAMGAARPPALWPKAAEAPWPELYARHAIRSVGLPRVRVTSAYLRQAMSSVLLPYAESQRGYHRLKAKRLAHAHHNLDRVSNVLFLLAILSVTAYLLLSFSGALHLLEGALASRISLFLTFLGVLLPTWGAAIAGIRYFGDFERFSAISKVTAEQLDAVTERIGALLQAPLGAIHYAHASTLAHALDDIVVGEIESWQAVFAGKHITVPV